MHEILQAAAASQSDDDDELEHMKDAMEHERKWTNCLHALKIPSSKVTRR
jgi:hypothetical protein